MAVACLMIANKYEETLAVPVAAYVHITGQSKGSILRMELDVLRAVEYSLTVPYSCTLIRRDEMEADAHSLALYLADLALIEGQMRRYTGLEVAEAAVGLSARILRRDKTRMANRQCMLDLLRLARRTGHVGVYSKYATEEFHQVSKLDFWG